MNKTLKKYTTGQFAKIYRTGDIFDKCNTKGRKNVVVKFFYKRPIEGNLEDYYWGTKLEGSKLLECTKFQNICYHHGLAPKVHEVGEIENKGKRYAYQVVDDLGYQEWKDTDGKEHERIVKSILEIHDKYGGDRVANLDNTYNNSIKDKYVDFQVFRLPQETYKENLIESIKGNKWGRFYQSVPELGLTDSFRDTEKRIGELGLKDIDFKGKTVLDIGCSNGQFCNYAYEHGAKRVVGIDLPVMIEPAFHLSNYKGYHNIDYYGFDLREATEKELREKIDIKTFDIVFYFSMITHIQFPGWVPSFVGDELHFEESGAKTDWMTQNGGSQAVLERHFKTAYRGKTTDYGRDLFFCKRS